MKYVFYENGISLKDTICQINNVELSSLDVSDFKVDDLKILNDFKDHLLSLKDKRFFIVGDYGLHPIITFLPGPRKAMA